MKWNKAQCGKYEWRKASNTKVGLTRACEAIEAAACIYVDHDLALAHITATEKS